MFLVAFGIGVAAAAYSDGVPGDPFYRAKRVAEQPAQIVDRDLVASNRLGELEELIDRGADADTVLTARTDAARALLDGQTDETMKRALSLMAWPGGLDGRGVDVDATDESLLITESEWFNEQGYTASLADGHLVTVSVLDGEILIGTTGDWTVRTTGTGWLLTNDGVEHVYFIQVQGQDLRVTSSGSTASASNEEAITTIGGPDGTTARARFGDPPEVQTGADGDEPPAGPSVNGTATAESGDADQGPSRSSGQSGPEPISTTPGSTGDGTTTTTRRTTSSSASPTTSGPVEQTTVTTAASTTSRPTSRPTQPGTSAAPPTTGGGQTTTSATIAPTTAAPTTTTAPTTPAPTTTTIPPAVAWTFYLENPGSGNTSSSANLPLATGSSPSGQLRNFDTNRDEDPGLLIKKDGGGLSVSDSTKNQVWTWTSSASTTFKGDAVFTVWLAAEDFEDEERIGLLASIEVCNPGCSRLGTAQWSGSASEDRFRSAAISFGSVNASVPAGATLRLKVVVPDGLASSDVMFAYDSASYPSRLSIG